jgi:hypothetical protein
MYGNCSILIRRLLMATHTSPLDHVKVATPCSARWEEMAGDDRARFCSHCNLNVYNLSAMRRDEAEALVASAEGRLCVRFYRRNDGTIITQDCPIGMQAARQRTFRRIRNTVAGATAMIAGTIWFGSSRLSWASGTVAGTMATIPPLSMPVGSDIQFNEGDELGEVAVVTMGDTTEPVIMGKMLPTEEDSVQEEEYPIIGIMVMPDLEDTTATQPIITPEPIETIGQAVVAPDDSAQPQIDIDIAPVEEPRPDIQ